MKCFVMFRLRPGVSFDDYLAWFRAVNLPAVARQTATRNLRVWRRIGVHEGAPTWDIVEELEVLDVAHAEREFSELPEMQAMLAEWRLIATEELVVFAEELARG